jgi:hypothetical protein
MKVTTRRMNGFIRSPRELGIKKRERVYRNCLQAM